MATPSITAQTPGATTYTFTTFNGELDKPAETIDDISRAGVDGHAYRTKGKRGEIRQVRTMRDVDDAAAALAAANAYRALQGQLCTVVDAHSSSLTNVMVHAVSIDRMKKVACASGGLSTTKGYIVEATWSLQRTDFA